MKKKLLSLLLSLAMSISLLASLPVTVYAEDSVNTFQGDGYKVTYTVNNSWQNNQNVGITVTNTGTESIENWALKYDASGEITGLWGGAVNKKDSSGDVLEDYSNINNSMATSNGTNEKGINVSFSVNEQILDYIGELTESGELIFTPGNIKYIMEDTNRKIYIYDRSNKDGKYTNTINTQSEPTPIVWSDPTSISTYTNVITAYDWWKSEFGYKGLNGNGGDVKAYVHDLSLEDNARYSWSILNESISFGDFTDIVSLGKSKGGELACVGHEYTHAIVRHKTSDFFAMKDKKPGTINEAYADIFGSFIDDNTWRTSPRNIAEPSKTDHPSYAGLSDTNYWPDFSIDEHHNATIISHAAYLMNKTYNIPFDKLHDLWYDSLAEGYNSRSDFYTVRTNVIKSARKNNFSYEEISAIKSAFDDVGIYEDTGSVKITILDGGVKVPSAKVTLINYGNERVENIPSSTPGVVTISDIEIGTKTIKIEIPGYEPIFTQVLIKRNKTVDKTIKIITSMNFESIDYEIYDHYDYPEWYSTSKPRHIIIEESSIKMLGYSSDPLKDFILIRDDVSSISDYKQVLLSFNIERDSNNWHTMEGGGFLFNASVSDDNILKGYCALVTQQGLKLYYISGIKVDSFRNGKSGNISNIGKLLGTYNIGDVLKNHEITLRIIDQKITLWDGDDIIIDNYTLPYDTNLHDFGPITSHISHACSQISYFTFSDITMNVISES